MFSRRSLCLCGELLFLLQEEEARYESDAEAVSKAPFAFEDVHFSHLNWVNI